MFDNLPAIPPSVAEIVEEYEAKRAAIPEAVAAFAGHAAELERASSIGGAFGGSIWGRYSSAPTVSAATLESVLLKSAWQHIIAGLNIRKVATALDLSKLETSMENPPELTLDTIAATFGKYLINPRLQILRGVAEAFAELDPAYKSHSKVKIGVAGLPKRIILTDALPEYGGGWRENQLRDVLNAMASLHDQPRMEYTELETLKRAARRGEDPEFLGVTVRGFANGNAHLIFDKAALRAINLALAEFYGDSIAADCDPAPEVKAPSTAVSAKLQYYPTPAAVVSELLSGVYFESGIKETREIRVLEPSCGCGRILDGVRAKAAGVESFRRASVRSVGIEYDPTRADECRANGHSVQTANFLQVAPQAVFDYVLMNPPFAGRHYAKHIRHAIKFLKPGGMLRAILPASAWYDHGELIEISGYKPNKWGGGCPWKDLPVASFAESGTNVPTGIFTFTNGRA